MAKVLIFDSKDMDEAAVQELVAFMKQGAYRRLAPATRNKPNELSFPGFRIHLKEQAVYLNDIPVPLSRYEFFTLCFLAEHPGWVFSKEQIYEAVWKEDGENCGTAVTNVVSQIRRKLKQEKPAEGFLQTVIGMGYKFMPGSL